MAARRRSGGGLGPGGLERQRRSATARSGSHAPLLAQLHGHGKKRFQQRQSRPARRRSRVAAVRQIECALRGLLLLGRIQPQHRPSGLVQFLAVAEVSQERHRNVGELHERCCSEVVGVPIQSIRGRVIKPMRYCTEDV